LFAENLSLPFQILEQLVLQTQKKQISFLVLKYFFQTSGFVSCISGIILLLLSF